MKKFKSSTNGKPGRKKQGSALISDKREKLNSLNGIELRISGVQAHSRIVLG